MINVIRKHKTLLFIAIIITCVIIFFNSLKNNGENFDTLTKPNFTSSYSSINFTKIDYVRKSNICLYKKPRIVILITSHIQNEPARKAIRESHPRDLFRQHNAQIIFLLAQRDKEIQFHIDREFQKFNDIVQGNFTEAYKNLTYKHYMGLHWTLDYCSSAKYVVKMDDDIVINYYVLFRTINRFKTKFHLMGHVIENMKPIRYTNNKWYVSKEEYAADQYPSFLSGWMYIATSEAVQLLLQQALYAKFFWIDDLFFTGILRESVNIKLTNIKNYFRYEPKNIECCIKNKYSCDFIVAPSGKDYQLNKNLNNHLWECNYKRICILESSMKISCLISNDFIPTKGYYSNSVE